MKKGRGVIWALSGILAVFFLVGIRNLDFEQLYSPDSAEFSILAKAMSSGAGGYRDISQPGNPPHTKFPLGYPLLLIPAALLFSKNAAVYLLACKTTTIFLGALTLLGVYFLFQPRLALAPEPGSDAPRRGGAAACGVLVILCAATPVFLLFSSNVMSETPLFCFSVWTLYLARRLLPERPAAVSGTDGAAAPAAAAPRRWEYARQCGDCLIVSVAIGAAYYVRGNGIALLPAIALHALTRGQGKFWGRLLKAVLITVFVAAIVTPWVLRDMKLSRQGATSGENYVSQILTPFENPFRKRLDPELALKRMRMNVRYYCKVALAHVFPWGDKDFSGVENYVGFPGGGKIIAAAAIIRAMIIVLIILGIGSHLKSQGLDLFILYPLCFAGLLIIFTYRQHRYLLPLLPFTYYFLLRGLRLGWDIGARLKAGGLRWASRGLGYALLATLLLANAYTCYGMVQARSGGGDSDTLVVGSWLDAAMKKDDVLMAYPYMWFFSGKKCVPFDPKGVSVPGFEMALLHYGINYILADAWMSDLTEYDTMIYSSRLFSFKKMTQIGNHVIYKVDQLKEKELAKRMRAIRERKFDFRPVIQHYKMLAAMAGAIPAFHNNLGYFYYQNGQLDESVREFQQAVALAPDDHIAHFNLGTAYLNNDEYEQALREYELVRKCEFGYTIQHVLNKNVEIATLKRGISEDPKSAGNCFIYFQVAQLWSDRGSYDKAINELKQALKLNPDFLEGKAFLAANYEARGEYQKAMREYEEILKKHPDAAMMKTNLAKLKKLARKTT
jgi:tetratricopeptide (TPR) repeat protein